MEHIEASFHIMRHLTLQRAETYLYEVRCQLWGQQGEHPLNSDADIFISVERASA